MDLGRKTTIASITLAGLCMLAAGPMPPAFAQQSRPAAAKDRHAPKPFEELTPAAREAIEKGLRWLAKRQYPDGAFGSGTYYRKHVAITALACMAFLSDGSVPGRGRYAHVVQRGLDFILNSASGSGLLAAQTSHGPMYGHGFATLLLAELYGMSPRPDLREKLAKAVRLIVATQNAQGGWRYQPVRADADISVTVCEVMALRAARNVGIAVPKKTIDAAIRYVKACQNADGGFSYQIGLKASAFPRSAAAVATLQYAGQYTGPEVTKGLEYIFRFLPGRGEVTGHYYYGHYYAAQATFFAGEEYWRRWYPAIRDELIAKQRPDGSWRGMAGEEYGTAMALIILQIPNRLLPIFQR